MWRRVIKITELEKVLATKLDDLNWIPTAHIMESADFMTYLCGFTQAVHTESVEKVFQKVENRWHRCGCASLDALSMESCPLAHLSCGTTLPSVADTGGRAGPQESCSCSSSAAPVPHPGNTVELALEV